MTDYKYPEWLTASERVPGEPLSRVPEFNEDHWTSDSDDALIRLREAIRAFHAKSAECRAMRLHEINLMVELEAQRTRAEKAEAECERLRKELESKSCACGLAREFTKGLA